MKFFLFLLLLSTSLFAEDKKLLMLFVKMEHCVWCEKMENEVFADQKVNTALQKQFVIKKLIYGSDTLPSVVKPKHFPTTYVLSLDGTKVIDSLEGYREKEKFLKFFSGTYEMTEDDL